MTAPKPMKDPCLDCPKGASCISSETYKCPRFQQVFIRAWDETVTHLRQMLHKEETKCP